MPWAATPWFVFANRAIALAVIWTTVSAIVRSREASLRLEERTRDLADVNYALEKSAIVAVTDTRGIITFVNDKFCEISKYSREELLGQDHRILNSGYHPKEFIRTLWTTIANGHIWRGEIRNRAKDGSFYWVDTTIVPFLDARGSRISTWRSATRSPTASDPRSCCRSRRRSRASAKWPPSSRTR